MAIKYNPVYWLMTITLGTTLGLVFIGLFPFIYNEHLTPLGRFSKAIEIGDSEEKVATALKAFQTQHSEITKIYDTVDNVDLYGNKIDSARVIVIYQKSLFDDMELSVLFQNKKITQKLFVGD